MKLGIIGTGKIVHEALFAMEEIAEIERTAIFARPKSRYEPDPGRKLFSTLENGRNMNGKHKGREANGKIQI